MCCKIGDADSGIDLEVTLGFLLKAFKSKFVEHIEHNFDRLLAKAHAAHKPAHKPAAAPSKAPAKEVARKKAAVKPAKKATRKG